MALHRKLHMSRSCTPSCTNLNLRYLLMITMKVLRPSALSLTVYPAGIAAYGCPATVVEWHSACLVDALAQACCVSQQHTSLS